MAKKKQTSERTATLADFRKAVKSKQAMRGVLFRDATVGAIDVEKRTVEVAFSSDTPVDRGYLVEILDHQPKSVDMSWINSGRAALLADHDPTVQIGVVVSAEIGKDRVGRAVVRFGKGAQADAYFQDVVDGIRTCISVGYYVLDVVLEAKTGEVETYRVIAWMPFEISFVSIPADTSVGVGRSDEDDDEAAEIIKQTLNSKENRNMTTENTPAANANPAPAATVDAAQIRADYDTANKTRSTEIMALAKRHGMIEKGAEFVGNGKTVEEFRSFVLENIGNANPVDTARRDNGVLGLNEEEAKSFSLVRAINATLTGDWRKAGFEREVTEATAKKFSQRDFKGQIQIPTEVLLVAQRGMVKQKRDMNVANDAQGGYLVATKMGSFIDMLENKLLVKQLGATVFGGLDGDVTFPKETGAPTHYWVNEGVDVTESTPSLGQIKITPKTVGAFTEVTRRMLLQSSLDVEAWLRNRLAKSLAKGIDKAALKGTGADGEPLGILNTAGIGSVTITTHTFTDAKMIDLESEVAIDNADLGKLAYLACAADRGRMKKQDIGTDTGKRVWTAVAGQPGVGEVNGYLAYATNQLAEDEVLFGNWEDLLIGEWGLLDLLVNPYANDKNGGVRIRALQDVDVALAHAESFARTAL